MSDEGEKNIWDTLGFDVCNTACWTDDAFAHDDSNQYNAYFRNYPYDVLNSIGMDNIGKISVVAISPTINEYVCARYRSNDQSDHIYHGKCDRYCDSGCDERTGVGVRLDEEEAGPLRGHCDAGALCGLSCVYLHAVA